MVWAEVTLDPIDPGEVLTKVGAGEDGAVLLFVGTVRNENEGRAVTGMEYQGYEAMARDQLAAILREAADRTGTERVAAVHRLGSLEIGEVSVAIAVSSPHRAPAFDGVRYVIEEIKKRLPVWKKEYYVEGTTKWLGGVQPAPEATP